ncbi:SEC14-like protein 2, partial [Nephila pilipes]
LRQRLKNDLPKDMYEDTIMFYKFLKARNFNLNQAESMLRKHLVFRKIVQIDTILTDYKPPE